MSQTLKLNIYRNGRFVINDTVFSSLADLEKWLLPHVGDSAISIRLVSENPTDFDAIGEVMYKLSAMNLVNDNFIYNQDDKVDTFPS